MSDTSDKYADKARPEFTVALDMVVNCYRTLKLVEPQLRAIDREERNSHSILHITNPSLYRDMMWSKKFHQTVSATRAALAFIDAIDAVKDEISANLETAE